MALLLLITLFLALGSVFTGYLWFKAQAALESERDIAHLVQGRRPPVVETIERWGQKHK